MSYLPPPPPPVPLRFVLWGEAAAVVAALLGALVVWQGVLWSREVQPEGMAAVSAWMTGVFAGIIGIVVAGVSLGYTYRIESPRHGRALARTVGCAALGGSIAVVVFGVAAVFLP